MKKIFMLLTALVAYCGGALADGLEVKDVNISQGGEATLEIALENPVTEFAAFQFNVELADGITIQAVYQADIPSSAPAVYTNPANPAQKLIRNGAVYILSDDQLYTIDGKLAR